MDKLPRIGWLKRIIESGHERVGNEIKKLDKRRKRIHTKWKYPMSMLNSRRN